MDSGSALDLVTIACDTPLRVLTDLSTTCTIAADATYIPLSTNELAMVKMEKKKRGKSVDRSNHDARNYI